MRLGDGAGGTAGIRADGIKVRQRGFPRIIKAGHGIKLGAVVCKINEHTKMASKILSNRDLSG